jgi:hypothetical protein
MASLSSARVSHRFRFRTFFCSREKNYSIVALSPQALLFPSKEKTTPADPVAQASHGNEQARQGQAGSRRRDWH